MLRALLAIFLSVFVASVALAADRAPVRADGVNPVAAKFKPAPSPAQGEDQIDVTTQPCVTHQDGSGKGPAKLLALGFEVRSVPAASSPRLLRQRISTHFFFLHAGAARAPPAFFRV